MIFQRFFRPIKQPPGLPKIEYELQCFSVLSLSLLLLLFMLLSLMISLLTFYWTALTACEQAITRV